MPNALMVNNHRKQLNLSLGYSSVNHIAKHNFP
jgi:hypothetical protein